MQLTTLALAVSVLSSLTFAAPTNNHALVPRQTYIITCIGGRCNDGSSSTPTPKPSTSKKPDPPKTTPMPTPSKTIKTTLKSTIQPTKTGGEETGPSSTACPVPLYYQCGGYYDGKPWTGCTECDKGAKCVVQNDFYNQCVAEE
ncbi:hypothetical protein EK21DRAFT_113297 [Setomelanomma holmii]|uniref:CBM1 domain-containing protein n=1 Tax=Setomelanomma holmii TaxID=210430 RepID=A0A9P4LLC4_9PLEO|nr:hypothetical protein EK21DRAFT_113297 [Setomelanomma holmii]